MATCYSRTRGYYRCNRTWSTWGRWLLFGLIIASFILFFFLFRYVLPPPLPSQSVSANPTISCLSARRRRKRGLKPFYGTGWVGNTPAGHGAATYNPQYQNQQQQPQYGNETQQAPAYGQNEGLYGQNQANPGSNQGYYGGQQTGATELQQPPNAYRGDDQVYSPPAGPPPGKDGVVR